MLPSSYILCGEAFAVLGRGGLHNKSSVLHLEGLRGVGITGIPDRASLGCTISGARVGATTRIFAVSQW